MKLLDYKGKFTIICDNDRINKDWDVVVGNISKEQAIKEADWRKENANYYGVPAYIGKDKDLLKIYEQNTKRV